MASRDVDTGVLVKRLLTAALVGCDDGRDRESFGGGDQRRVEHRAREPVSDDRPPQVAHPASLVAHSKEAGIFRA
jgi:hypothetical protein